MNKPVSILFVGVGGQGTILASKILTEALLEKGYDVKMTEVHGMAQRGGSVTTEVRFGEKVYSPLIEKGD
ncbi:MAG: 2-oxoacid:acceptor oxidoreductase family protein, partial [Bacillota bacterium]|nr:2-oxoacid:acceptor oxidoreductase family protein [Bacillota bacterium]